jgi:hypothetical protein
MPIVTDKVKASKIVKITNLARNTFVLILHLCFCKIQGIDEHTLNEIMNFEILWNQFFFGKDYDELN